MCCGSRPDIKYHLLFYRFSFCDLAGAKTGKSGSDVLSRCIKALRQKEERPQLATIKESNITRLCQPALSGLQPLTVIVTVNPMPHLIKDTQQILHCAGIVQSSKMQRLSAQPPKGRFSLLIDQTPNTATDWETALAVDTDESGTSATANQSDKIFCRESWNALLEENERLKREKLQSEEYKGMLDEAKTEILHLRAECIEHREMNTRLLDQVQRAENALENNATKYKRVKAENAELNRRLELLEARDEGLANVDEEPIERPITCACKSGCKTKACGCKKSGNKCSDDCQCPASKCKNS